MVLPVFNVDGYLAACLDSVLDQTLKRLEVILVDDGSQDRSAQIAADYAARDPRITIITQTNQGLGAARNAGIAAASAPFLTFLDSDDTVPPTAYATMVDSLERTGSDFAVGAIRRLRHGKSTRPGWVTQVHRVQRLHVTIDDFPEAMQDVIACNRMFRRDFWDREIHAFPTGVAYEDHAPMVAAYVRAAAFDLLADTTYVWRIREDATSIGQQKHLIGNLRDRLSVKDRAWDVVSREASAKVRAAWLGRVLGIDLPMFVANAVHADDDYRQLLQDAVTKWSEHAEADAWRHVKVDKLLLLTLTRLGDWSGADRLLEYLRLNGCVVPTRVSDGRVFADLPASQRFPVEECVLELSEQQTSLAACVRRARWRVDGCLEVDGWAFAQAVDLTDVKPVIEAQLVDSVTGARVQLEVGSFSSAAITRWANHPHHRYDTAGFTLAIPVDSLPSAETGTVRWQLMMTVEARGVRRTGSVHSMVRSGIALRMRARPANDPDDPHRFLPVMDDALGFALQVSQDRLRAADLRSDGPRQLSGAIRPLVPPATLLEAAVVRQGRRTLASGDLTQQPDGSFAFSLLVPLVPGTTNLDFRVRDARGRHHRVSWPSGSEGEDEIGRFGPDTARWHRTAAGHVALSRTPETISVHQVTVDADCVAVEVSAHGVSAERLSEAVLVGPKQSAGVVRLEPITGGGYRLSFPAQVSSWGSGTLRPLTSGTYTVEVPLTADSGLPIAVTPALMEDLPLEFRTASHGVTIARKPGSDQLTIALGPPLGDDERGRTEQRRLQRWYGDTEFAPREAVLFQCYRGEVATDSQLAIHQELVRRQSPLELWWGVHDLSVDVPDGGRPVLIGSREWYEVLGSARYLCNNVDFDRSFRRRDHQKFLQTFHGYPFKSMGVSYWQSRNVSEQLIAERCRRRNASWSTIVVPSSFCEEIYRREYRYHGEVLVTGYPRNDVLIDADPARRTAILARLGISSDKTVVLYAPTWREANATGSWSAKFFEALELDTLAAALGDDYVVLLRGHSFNLREGEARRHARDNLIDVTGYPEINDLLLAADVAVLDYSSVRFDWLLTGKPVLFFVPDLDDYFRSRSALFDFEPTAPGPHLMTTEQVLESIRDLQTVADDYARAIKDANQTFNELHDGRSTERVVASFFT